MAEPQCIQSEAGMLVACKTCVKRSGTCNKRPAGGDNVKTNIKFIKLFARSCSIACLLLGLVQPAFADQVYWTDWTSATPGNPGSASGTITLPDLSTVTVSYTGEINFAQTTGAGTNYWSPSATFTSLQVANAPPTSDIIALAGGNATVDSITFSKLVTDPVMAIMSLGRTNQAVTYAFNTPFTILSSGASDSFAGGGVGSLTNPSGNVLQGTEGNGTIQFSGTFSSISWTASSPSEYWHGFTIGVPSVGVSPVPDPSTLWLLASGLLGLLATRRRVGS
jgi:hypothetical protein